MAPLTGNEDIKVDVTECTELCNNEQVETGCDDGVESTSSFGDTSSEGDSFFGGMKVESPSRYDDDDATDSGFDDYGSEFHMRRKSQTDHWRRFIGPLRWRCKWLELQIKNIRSQCRKYDRKLTDNAERKMFDYHTFLLQGFDGKSLPFHSSSPTRKKAMKRKKRKRAEKMTHLMPYMLQHNVFSYYEHRKSAGNFGSLNGDCSNLDKTINATDEFRLADEWPIFESNGHDNIYKNLLWKIEGLQSQVRKLKARIEKVETENPKIFSSVNMLRTPAPSDELNNSGHNPSSVPQNGDPMAFRSINTISQHTSDFRTGNLLPERAVTSHGEFTLPNMIQSTDQPQVQVSVENTGEGFLKDNQRAKEETKDKRCINFLPGR